jgi:AraC family transcriptional regulator of adaptative response/methylated-DNA-[protein]-cysteine methyltransferase
LFGEHTVLDSARAQLEEYFAGRRTEFTLPLDLGGTPFQRLVWEQLRQIPYGSTKSYEALAKSIGRPGAPRAVGRANGDNRLAIVIPCHRIVRSDGTLGGYGGGKWRKQALLELEQTTLLVNPS